MNKRPVISNEEFKAIVRRLYKLKRALMIMGVAERHAISDAVMHCEIEYGEDKVAVVTNWLNKQLPPKNEDYMIRRITSSHKASRENLIKRMIFYNTQKKKSVFFNQLG